MSITAVPLRPVSKSGLWTLWTGIALLVALAVSFAIYTTYKPQIDFVVVKEGTGASPTETDVVLVKYKGTLDDGTVFDENEQAAFPVNGVVPGFRQGLTRMKKGGAYKLTIPAKLGYGAAASGPIPANSTLHFDVTLIDYRSEAEVRAMQAQMEQMQQQMQGGGMPGGAPPR